MAYIYLLLARCSTIFSSILRLSTGADYTYVALSVSSDPADGYYSFGRQHRFLPIPVGFVHENKENGFLSAHPTTPCILLALPVEDRVRLQIQKRLEGMERCIRYYHYNLLGVLLRPFGWNNPRRRWYSDAQFVGEMLSYSTQTTLPKPVCQMQPMDYLRIQEARLLYTGTVGELFSQRQPHPSLANSPKI